MDWNNNNDDAWGEMMNQYNEKMIPSKPDYPEPEPEPPSKKELMNNLLDALIIALEKGNKEEITAIEDQLILLRITR